MLWKFSAINKMRYDVFVYEIVVYNNRNEGKSNTATTTTEKKIVKDFS